MTCQTNIIITEIIIDIIIKIENKEEKIDNIFTSSDYVLESDTIITSSDTSDTSSSDTSDTSSSDTSTDTESKTLLNRLEDDLINPNISTSILPKLDISLSKNWIKLSNKLFNKDKNYLFAGPILASNWLIHNIFLVGGAIKTQNDFESIKSLGIDTFICLYGEDKDEFYEYEINLLKDNFIHFPITDMKTGDKEKIKLLCIDITKKILNGNKIYLHCAGGHGRTGIIASIVLHILYPKLTVLEIFDYIQYAHDQRDGNYFGLIYYNFKIEDKKLAKYFTIGQVPSPQTTPQRKQVEEIINELILERI